MTFIAIALAFGLGILICLAILGGASHFTGELDDVDVVEEVDDID